VDIFHLIYEKVLEESLNVCGQLVRRSNEAKGSGTILVADIVPATGRYRFSSTLAKPGLTILCYYR
jgi:hypothetical protein